MVEKKKKKNQSELNLCSAFGWILNSAKEKKSNRDIHIGSSKETFQLNWQNQWSGQKVTALGKPNN